MNKKILIVIFIVILLAGAVYLALEAINGNKQVACTTEAKICPDGSAVGRIGPNCEFAPCPDEISIVGWKTFKDNQQSIEFQYPEKLPANFMNAVEWPPKITIADESLSCPEMPSENDPMGQAIRGIINNHIYCVGAVIGAAAGSTYTDYTYATEKDNKMITLSFTLQSPQCVNYEDSQKTQCQNERNTFNLDGIIDRIIQSVKILPVK